MTRERCERVDGPSARNEVEFGGDQ